MTSSWLQKQRKGDLIELCDSLGITDYEGLKKSEVELLLDDFLTANDLRGDATVAGFYAARDRMLSSPLKREFDPIGSRPSRRRTGFSQVPDIQPSPAKRRSVQTSVMMEREFVPSPTSTRSNNGIKLEIDAEVESEQGLEVEGWEGSPDREMTHEEQQQDEQYQVQDRSLSPLANDQALASPSPSRHATPAANIPASPAVLARAIDNKVVALHERFSDLVQQTGVHEQTDMVRSALSTVHSVLLVISAFEMWQMRPALLPAKHAFTVPALHWLGMASDMPISLPDVFLLLTSAFWSPFLTWTLTSLFAPALAGYFFNLTSNRQGVDREGRKTTLPPQYTVDPLTFSIVKAIMSYVVYSKGVTFQGWLSEDSIQLLVDTLYGGSTGVLVGTSVTGLMSIYDAILRK